MSRWCIAPRHGKRTPAGIYPCTNGISSRRLAEPRSRAGSPPSAAAAWPATGNDPGIRVCSKYGVGPPESLAFAADDANFLPFCGDPRAEENGHAPAQFIWRRLGGNVAGRRVERTL